jgi:hypothetical protein
MWLSMNGGQWCWIPKTLIQNHAIKLGSVGITVYNVLASMADMKSIHCGFILLYIRANDLKAYVMTYLKQVACSSILFHSPR